MQVGGQLPENATKNWFAAQLASSVQVFTLIESHGLVFYLMSHATLKLPQDMKKKEMGIDGKSKHTDIFTTLIPDATSC